jgi:hypothetical protein
MLAGGSEGVVIPSAIGGFIACKALSKRNEDPAAASRPWDRDRDGFVMGEGAGGCNAGPGFVQLCGAESVLGRCCSPLNVRGGRWVGCG